ncbi:MULTISPECIES: LysR family transcriptional regulator [Variovorax]|jgi:DNA-binding transcriptional LysR family regulator|uniref:LysR family transcriptional regulator n=1 Tax=Variovorax TaxID=34072 RepID=UPI00086EE97B|nr:MULTISPECIES: LysR family transcriptional regulator [Variovorax]MBN8758388.1 LysR family transcriptional regulator [Variovorax sp.]ODU12549.1 MAG: transcriptional regulator [Variovorax sp. SCN 67-85]ODV18097.1 MAG: transcriptional regulator [Variovorax sp. SCN 67-20]OJZ05954.1 MAG: transcriptional regulator [Variovorax sp. 67-131]UKI08864.1 LysR substrate-binding domain-containing protein [Variovorax paradoxus]
MDHLTALKVFRTTAATGSFAGAARQMGLSAAAVSKNIAQLEAHLKVRLINRTTRQMSLTEAGAAYHERLSRILDELSEADAALAPMGSSPGGVLRVSAPLTFALTSLSPAIPEFMARYPNLRLELNLQDSRSDIIGEGYDLAIRGSDRLEDSSLVARRLMTMDHVLCGAPGYFATAGRPARPEDLKAHECVQFTLSGHANKWTFSRAGRSVAVPVDGRYKVSSSIAVRDALLAGFGLSLIPRIYVEHELASGRLQAVLEDWEADKTPVYAVYPSRHLAAKTRVFVDFLAERFSGR